MLLIECHIIQKFLSDYIKIIAAYNDERKYALFKETSKFSKKFRLCN